MNEIKGVAPIVVGLVIILAIVVAAGVWYATRAPEKPVTLTVTNREGWKCTEPMFARLSEFEEATEITINEIDIPPKDMTMKILSEFVAGTGAYDIIQATVEADMKAYKDYVLSLDDFIIEDFGSVDAYKSKISPVAMDATVWDGHVKYVPFHGNVRYLFYRKDLFEDPDEKAAFKAEYGYDLKPPETPEELVDVASFFTRPEEGLWGYATGLRGKYAQHWLECEFLTAGIEVVDLKTHTCDFASGPKREKAIEITKFLHDLVWEYEVIPEECLGMGHAEMMESIKEAKYAMADDWWGDHWAVLNSPEYKAAIGPIGSTMSPHWPDWPESKGGRTSIWALGITKTCEDPEAAWEFIKWFTSKEIIQEEAKNSGAGSHWVEIDADSAAKGWLGDGLVEALPFTTPPREGFIDEGPTVVAAFMEEAEKMIHDPDPAAPEKMVDALAERIDDILAGK